MTDESTPATDEPTGEGVGTLRQDDAEREHSRQLSLLPPESPGEIPGYEILSCLGEGSFGSVWLARELRTGKSVAIKFYTKRRGLDWSLLTREVEKLAVLSTSRNVVGLLDVGWNHDPPYFVMEYLENGSLSSHVDGGALPVSDAVRIAKAVARGLVHAHGSGILHCDLKPANVLLDREGEPRLGDFGQSRLATEQSPALGTMFYMGPEQADLHAVPDARWDVYALGALLYHMLTGAPPHRTPENEARIRASGQLAERLDAYRSLIASAPPPTAHRQVPGIDKELVRIIDGCLAANPEDRLPNAQVVLDRLERREEVQAKRPLIALGFLGPVLLLFAMSWIAWSYVPRAVGKAGDHLAERALAGDEISAVILADSIHRELRARRQRLEEVASTQAVRTMIREAEGLSHRELFELIEESSGRSDELAAAYAAMNEAREETDRRLRAEGRTVDRSWFVQDSGGRQIYRRPSRNRRDQPQGTIGRNYHWRSYFHGGSSDLDRDIPVGSTEIRRQPGVSAPFRSEAPGQYMIAIAVPVWDEAHHDWLSGGRQGDDPGEVLGVLASTLHLSELLSHWEAMVGATEESSARPDRFLALVNVSRSGDEGVPVATLLDHPWMTEQHLRAVPSEEELDALMDRLGLDRQTAAELKRLREGEIRQHRVRDYRDPIAREAPEYAGAWLAVFAPVEDTPWVAVVQERSNTALAPIADVTNIFYQAGLVAILVFAVLLAVLWYLINRASA
ncbi:MAG: serine/threonine protein kinase [Planctomycetota bacterium]|nr:MAG: serine/threonine protein kinase [Planctomycetota bacterium]